MKVREGSLLRRGFSEGYLSEMDDNLWPKMLLLVILSVSDSLFSAEVAVDCGLVCEKGPVTWKGFARGLILLILLVIIICFCSEVKRACLVFMA